MKRLFIPVSMAFLLLLASCYSVKRHATPIIGGENEAIEIAVNDFLKSCYLRKQDTSFRVRVYNDYPDFLIIRIGGSDHNKLYPDPRDIIGEKKGTLPTNYIEKKGKLFYWDDSTKVLTLETVSLLSRYKRLDSTFVNGFNECIPPYVIDDSKKAAHYYFCKDDLSKFKKVVTSIGCGWYDPPKVKCGKGRIDVKRLYPKPGDIVRIKE